MSDNIHPEIVELRHRVMVLESLNANLQRRLERCIDPLAVGPDRTIHIPSILRVVLVASDGRKYDRSAVECSLSFQDGGRTLKVFVDTRYGN